MSCEISRYLNDHGWTYFYNFLKTEEQLHILDLGCGTGHLIYQYFIEQGTGVDFSSNMFKFTRNLFTESLLDHIRNISLH